MTANESMIELWNSEETGAWTNHPDRYDSMLEPFGTHLLDAIGLTAGRVLDVGCGAGALTLAVAAQSDHVTGADISRPLLALARHRADEAGARNVSFIEADAQSHHFDDTYDAIVSRFGVMFFDDPVEAFSNLRSVVRPQATLGFVCWQPLMQNEWAMTPVLAVMPHVGVPTPPGPEDPGPFSFGDPDRIHRILDAAGWQDVTIDDLTTRICVGGAATAEQALAYYREDAFGKVLFGDAEPHVQDAAAQALLAELTKHESAGGVRLGAACWIVTATAAPL